MSGKRISALIIATGAAVALAACSGPKPQEFGRAEVNAITKQVQDFVAAYNAKDVDKTAAVFSGSAVLMPPNGATLHGIDSIKAYYRNRFVEGGTDLVIEPKEINGVGTLAFMTATYRYKNRPESGLESRDRGKFLWILRNMGGGQWRCEYHVWNSDLPLPSPPPAK
jgi:ketosteroid isomerase-like protein